MNLSTLIWNFKTTEDALAILEKKSHEIIRIKKSAEQFKLNQNKLQNRYKEPATDFLRPQK